MPFEIRKAVKREMTLLIAFVGPMNCGKTFSALLFAAGLLKPGQRAVVIDTEKGRSGDMYASNKRVMAAMPQGFDVIELDAPYEPKRFVGAIDTAENAGYKVCLIDSFSDSYDGVGGISDMAEKAGNSWTKPKLENKRMMTRMQLSGMHIICCIKAQEKTKIVKTGKINPKTNKEELEYIPLGMRPITEKSNFFPMTLAFNVDPETHISTTIKTHDDLAEQLAQPRLITPKDGQLVRLWNGGGKPLEDNEQLIRRSKDAAGQGVQVYREFFEALTPAQKKSLGKVHDENKATAAQADKDSAPQSDAPKYEDFPPMEGLTDGAMLYVKGKLYKFVEERTAFEPCTEAA
jgi:hypothetical protein